MTKDCENCKLQPGCQRYGAMSRQQIIEHEDFFGRNILNKRDLNGKEIAKDCKHFEAMELSAGDYLNKVKAAQEKWDCADPDIKALVEKRYKEAIESMSLGSLMEEDIEAEKHFDKWFNDISRPSKEIVRATRDPIDGEILEIKERGCSNCKWFRRLRNSYPVDGKRIPCYDCNHKNHKGGMFKRPCRVCEKHEWR